MGGRVARLTNALELSVSPGERVAVMTPNVHQAMEAHYAITGGCRALVLNLNQR